MQTIHRGTTPDPITVKRDARRIFNMMRSGGVSIIPFDVSYAIFAHTARAVEKIYELKNRSNTKPNGVLGNWDSFNELIDCDSLDRDIVKCVTLDHDLPLSVVGNYRAEHDFFRTVEFGAIRRSTKGPTMDLLMNAGPLHQELARLSFEASTPLMGSSANRSLQGNKFCLHDIEPEVLDHVDISVDYGRCKYANPYLVGSTIIEMGTRRVLRFGCLYEEIQHIINKQFGIALPNRPTEGSMSLV